jgi:hypothetical protein
VEYFAQNQAPDFMRAWSVNRAISGSIPPGKRAASLGRRLRLHSMPGIQPGAPSDRLYVDPALPDWLPDITLTDMKIRRPRFDLRFWRDGRDTQWEVLRGEAGLVSALRPGSTCNLYWKHP